MRILFTGGTGVLGAAAVPRLTEGGHQVTAVGRSDLDLFDPGAVAAAVAGADAVFHFATAIPSQDRMMRREAWQTNDRLRSEATRHLVDAALAGGVKTFVLSSIALIYADGGDGWLDEDSPVEPPFSAVDTALTAEMHAGRFTAGGGRGVALRLGRLYGPGRVSFDFLAGVAAGRIPVVGRGANYVSHLHIADAGSAVAAALAAPAGIYNVVEDDPVTVAEEMALLVSLLQASPPRRVPAWVARRMVGPAVGLLTVSQRVSNRRFREATGWAPDHLSVQQGWPEIVGAGRREGGFITST